MDSDKLQQIFSIYQRSGARSIQEREDGKIVLGWTESAFSMLTDEDVAKALESIAAMDYRALRGPAYPPIGDQLDALWKGGQAAADMLATIQAVKAKYPKA